MVDYSDYPQLIETIKSTEYTANPHYLSGDSRPQLTPEFYGWPLNAEQAAQLFCELISNITDTEYGDFKRRANTYICNLREHMKAFDVPATGKIDEMQFYTQFLPEADVERTRKRLLNDARALLPMVQTRKAERSEKRASIKRENIAIPSAA